MCALRDELDALKCRAITAPPAPPDGAPAATLDALLGGSAGNFDGRTCWVIRTAVGRTLADAAASVDAGTVVVDIETGGFSGTPVFLIGALLVDCQAEIVQFLARDYPEEAGVLSGFTALAGSRGVWVTFNGKSFDEPFLRDRATRHHIALPAPREHVDVLHAARRQWRGQLPDFKLATLERHILGRARVDDVPGSDVPDLFHHFIRTGNARPLRGVLEHNRLDLLASLELLVRLGRCRPSR
jgi:hypothetical protein